MIEIDKDSESIIPPPFQGEIVLDNFSACGNRSEVLSQMKEAVQNGVALIVLTGEEGSGKTMLCHFLEQEMSPLCITIFFSRNVDSFEDVVRVIARRLGLDAVIEVDGSGVEQAEEQIIDFLLSEPVELFIIFDEAENLFLATLERIRKMLDRIIESGGRMTILLSGQETLLENCEQLSICDFQNTDDLHFDLVPLTRDETADYLRNCAVRLTDLDANKVFVDEVVDNIYSLAKGNFRMTHNLGEESMKSHSDDTSFMVLWDGVKKSFGIETENSYARKIPLFLRESATYLPWIGGGLCCLLLLFFLFSSGDNDGDIGQEVDQTEKIVQTEALTVVQEVEISVPEESEPMTVELSENVQLPVESEADKEIAVQVSEKKLSGDEVVVVAPGEKSTEQNIDQVSGVVEQLAVKEKGTVVEEVEQEKVAEARETQTAQETAKREVVNIVNLRATHDLKKKSVLSPEPQRVVIKVQSRKEVRNFNTPSAPLTVDQLYDERVLAGLRWKRRETENMYTVQLMVLASKTAEKNLKKMLAQVNYRQEAGNFYIFKKATAPESIFIFYGEYPNIERARLVTKSLPQFLRSYEPYALSIKGAIAKVKK